MSDKVTRITPETRHLSDEESADLARNHHALGASRMQQHLEDGCDECSRRLRIWKAVSRVAGREAAYHPPAAAVRQARGQYALRGPRSFFKRAAHAATLLFDSLREPLPVGVRAGAPSARLLLYGKGGRLLKLRVESRADSEGLCLVGQVVDEREPQRKLPDLPVLVQSGSKTVNQTLTNQSGEFALELEPALSLRLVVGMPGPGAIMVALPVAAAVDDDM